MWTMSKAPRYSTQFFPNHFVYLQYNPPPITVINFSEDYPSLSSVSDSQTSSSGSIISESFGNQNATSNSKHDSLPDHSCRKRSNAIKMFWKGKKTQKL